MEIQNTQTAENLHKALAGESIARNKYTYFAQAARANGDEEAAAAFEQMAQNEMMHARFWFELLYGKPTDTKECLTQAAMGEYSEWHDMYPDFAAQARAEGLEDIAAMFEKVATIERSHEGRFMTLLAQMTRTEPEQARYYVTRQTANPAVLLEVGFMVNPLEYEECINPVNILKTACGAAEAILDIIK